MNRTESQDRLHGYTLKNAQRLDMSYDEARRFTIDVHPSLARKADAELLDGLSPSGKLVALAGRHAEERGYSKQSLGGFIKARREELGISPRNLGLACGCNAEDILAFEGGDLRNLEKARLTLLAGKLKVTLSALQDLIPSKDSSGHKIRVKLEKFTDDVLRVAHENPEIWREYELDGRDPAMGEASFEALRRAYNYQDEHPEVAFIDAVQIVFNRDRELFKTYDVGKNPR